MIWIFLGVLVAGGEAAKLDNTYLPPPAGAKESGGSGTNLQLPLEPPYIDQYSPNSIQQQPWRPGTRAIAPTPTPVPSAAADDSYLENEEEITVPEQQKGRFISGSYSYTGPDNVLVTVTYKASDKKAKKEEEQVESEEEAAEDDEETEEDGERSLSEEEEGEVEEEDSVVPTPPTLPSELARAFDFHKKKHSQAAEEKTNRPKKPIRKTHNKLGNKNKQTTTDSDSNYRPQHAGHQHNPQATQPGYHYNPAPSGLYGAPTIHQGYSYPKLS